MNARRLLAAYPRDWRARYGDELEEVLSALAADGRLRRRDRLDVVRAGARARLARLRDPRAGATLVLWAWALFVVGGVTVAKTSEHWGAATPGGHTAASVAFTALTVGACGGSACVLAGIAVTLPGLGGLLARGDGPTLRRPLARAFVASLALCASFGGLVVWAHRLTAAQRAGHDARYAAAFLVCAAVGVACLAGGTSLAARIVRGLDAEPGWAPRARGWLAAGAALAMTVMAAATLAWWIAVATASPAALVGAHGAASPWVPQLIGAAVAMGVAATIGAIGARASLATPGGPGALSGLGATSR